MNSFTFVALFAALACANAGLLAAPSAKIIQGPSTRTTIVGPDGSAISAVAPGGSIITEEQPGVVAHTAPVVAAAPVIASYAAPAVVSGYSAYAAPSVLSGYSAYAAPVAYASPAAYAAPIGYAASGLVAQKSLDTLVAGPSGTIATSRTVAAPTVYAASPLAYGAHGLYL